MSKVKIVGSCWEWKASKNHKGYGQFRFEDKILASHRFSYQLFKGDLDPALQIDHLCRNRLCVNPQHLEQVTIQENIKRSSDHFSPQTHCKNNHKLTVENIYFGKEGGRRCKICTKIRRAVHYKKRKELKYE